MYDLRACAVIPTYNNRVALRGVIEDAMRCLPVIVVDDGSTDGTGDILSDYAGRVEVVSYACNRGKGYALSRGFDRAWELGYRNVVTMDSDGQHYASDITLLLDAASTHPGALIVGSRNLKEENMPRGNSFANRFSNFWFTLQTSVRLPDTQTGMRLYPLESMRGLRPLTRRYEAELELLVRAAWRGIDIVPVAVRVYYAPAGERVSHFRPGVDFVRISLLNAVLTLLAVVYGYPSIGVRRLLKVLKSGGDR